MDEYDCHVLPIGRHAHVHFIEVTLDLALPVHTEIAYDLLIGADGMGKDGAADNKASASCGVQVHSATNTTAGIALWAPHLLHGGGATPTFVLRSRADNILYGFMPQVASLFSRRPGTRRSRNRGDPGPAAHPSRPDHDGRRPSLCGRRSRSDAGGNPRPHQRPQPVRRSTRKCCGDHSQALYFNPATYYRREFFLPALKSNKALREHFFGGVKKPVFTTSSAHNHLLTFAEMMAMYLLVWSLAAWPLTGDPSTDDSARRRAHRRLPPQSRALDGFRATVP